MPVERPPLRTLRPAGLVHVGGITYRQAHEPIDNRRRQIGCCTDADEYQSLERCRNCLLFGAAMDEIGVCCDRHVKIATVRRSDPHL
jgi:hypothetical protein